MPTYNLLAYGGTGLGYGRPVGYSFTADTSNTANVVASDDDAILNDWTTGNYNGTPTPGISNGDVNSIAVSSDIPWLEDGNMITSGVWYTLSYVDPVSGETEEVDAFLIWDDDDNEWGGYADSYVFTTAPLIDGVTYEVTFESNPQGGVPWNVLICFAKGTRIRTPNGDVPVEHLQIGDRVVTQDNGPQVIRWIHSTAVSARGTYAPIKIAAGALGNARDLWVSPNHRMLIEDARAELLFGASEMLVPAKALVDDASVRAEPRRKVTYYHLMCDRHEVIYAEGAPTESFHPGQYSIGAFEDATRDELFALFPDLCSHPDAMPLARPLLRPFEAQLLSKPQSRNAFSTT